MKTALRLAVAAAFLFASCVLQYGAVEVLANAGDLLDYANHVRAAGVLLYIVAGVTALAAVVIATAQPKGAR